MKRGEDMSIYDVVSKYAGETMYCPKCKRLVTPKPPIDYEEDGKREVISGYCPYCGSKIKKVIA
jgi:DNA-directed RNA polymerase subunit RPC12/RpoP